ncbi:MAG: hypothetical protein BMS9Abin37_3011 [Acidobacteriota bacterium]|nr:MAG: hypothetical protein BMS9Abin37_3011 [Acidobacteriota bacterium]
MPRLGRLDDRYFRIAGGLNRDSEPSVCDERDPSERFRRPVSKVLKATAGNFRPGVEKGLDKSALNILQQQQTAEVLPVQTQE